MSVTCANCGRDYKSKRSDSVFCSARCKADYHRHHDPVGIIRSVRKLKRGRVSVVLWFYGAEAIRAYKFNPDENVVMGSDEEEP